MIINIFRNCNWYLYFSAASVNLLALATGNAFGWTSPAFPILCNLVPANPLPNPITKNEESLIAALLHLGATFGPIVAGKSAKKFGRKKTLLVFSLCFTVANILIALTGSITCYFIARFMLGLGVGSAFTVIPMYVGEIAENTNRGVLGCFLGVFLSVGIFLSYLIGPFTSIFILSLCCAVPSILFLVLFGLFGPESPYYLVSINDTIAAEESLKKLRNKSEDAIKKDLLNITKNVEESNLSKGGFNELFKCKAAIRGLSLAIASMFFQQFSGIAAVIIFMQPIFDASGSKIPGNVSTAIVGLIKVISNIIASQLVDRLGRRILFLISSCGCFLSHLGLGTFFFLKSNNFNVEPLFWLPICSLTVYVIAYNIGLGPLPWAISGELFPTHLKPLCSTITTCSCLIMAFLITVFFPTLSLVLGMANSFWIFGVCCAFATLFFTFMLPETKGKSLEEIQIMLKSK